MNDKSSLPKPFFTKIVRVSILIPLVFLFQKIYGQTFESISLRVGPYNNFAEGYRSDIQQYDGDFIRNIISNSADRQIIASVARSIPETTIKMISNEDGQDCQSEKWRLLPNRAAFFLYTLKRKHPLLPGKMLIVDSIRKTLTKFVKTPGIKCFPLVPLSGKVIVKSRDCEVKLTVPIPQRETTESSIVFTVEFQVLDAQNKVVISRSKNIKIIMHVPIIVSIGESFASGEGNPDTPGEADGGALATAERRHCQFNTTVMIAFDKKPEMKKKAVWFESKDHRSLKSFHALATKEMLKDWPFVVYLSFAKSGAKIISTGGDDLLGTQIQLVRNLLGDTKIDVLLVSAGGNDVGFADVLSQFGSDFFRNSSDHARRVFEDRLSGLRENGYPTLARQIERLNVSNVVISEYPGHLFCDADGKPKGGCGVFNTLQFFRISKANAARMDSMGNALNKEVKRAADRFGWHYVTGISDRFKTHGYCSGNSYYVHAEESCKKQGDFNGTMHPNAKGIRVCAEIVGKKLRQIMPAPSAQQGALTH